MNSGEWWVELEGVVLSGGDGIEGLGCLSVPPDGLGMPELRTEDVTYVQSDGVKHFNDWYSPRIITLEEVTVHADGCPGCPSARRKARQISQAWSRKCEDVELVIHTDCEGTDPDRSLVGPFGVIGRPRVASKVWSTSNFGHATFLLRFDAVDHRMYVLDEDGTPGSGVNCVTLEPSSESACRTYDRCYDDACGGFTYEVEEGGTGATMEAVVGGTECVYPTITLSPTLTDPRIENLTTGEVLTYRGVITESAGPVVIDTDRGTATQGGASRTNRLVGNRRLSLEPGINELRLISFSPSDDGNAEICWRDVVIEA